MTAVLNYSQAKPSIAIHHTCTHSLLSGLILVGFFWGGWLALAWGFVFGLGFMGGWGGGVCGFFSLQGFFGKQITLPQAPRQQQDPACRYHSATHTAWVHPHPPVQRLLHKLAQLEGDAIDGARTLAEEQTASPYFQGPEKKKEKEKKTPKTTQPPQNTPYYSHLPMN